MVLLDTVLYISLDVDLVLLDTVLYISLDVGLVLLDIPDEPRNQEKICSQFGLVLAEAGFSLPLLVNLVHTVIKEPYSVHS